MNKITFNELKEIMRNHNKTNYNEDLYAIIVFTEDSFVKKYPLESRSYRVKNTNKMFVEGLISNSLYGTSIDETDEHVRLDWYIGYWKIDYCYME